MKKSKRLISFLLALMLMPVFNIGAAEKSSEQLIGLQLLESIGVLDESQTQKAPDEKVSRAEYAEILVKLADADTLAYSYYETDFSYDVSSDYYEAGYINAAVIMGLMENKEGIFAPTESLTYNEAIRAMVKLLGYDAIIKDDSDAAFMAAAQKAGILSGLKKNDDGTISRETMFRLIDNSLDAEIITEKGVGENGGVLYEKAGTLLAEIHDIYTAEGVISATKYGALSTDIETTGGTIRIDGIEYSTGGGKYTEYLGYNVKVYYTEYGETKDVVFIAPDDNEILTIPSDRITNYSKRTYTYLDEDDDTETASTIGATVIYNGVSAEGTNFAPIPAQGEVNFVDSDGDGEYDIVSILNYVDYVIAAVDAENEKIYPKYDTALDFSDYEELDIYDSATDNVLKLTDIAADDVISVLNDPMNTKAVIYRSNTTVTGMVKSITTEDKTYLNIGENSYEYANVFNEYVKNGKTSACEIGGNYTFSLNHFGKIAWISSLGNYMSDFSFGIAVAEKIGKAFGDDVTLKVYTQLGLFEYFNIAENCEIDGIKCKKPSDALKHFYKDGEGAVPESGTFIPQPLRFKTNEKTEITDIDLVGEKQEGKKALYLAYDASNEDTKSTTQLLYNPAFKAFGVGSNSNGGGTPKYALGSAIIVQAPYSGTSLDASASHDLYGNYTFPTSGNTSLLGKAYKTDASTLPFEFLVKKVSVKEGKEVISVPAETQIHLFLEKFQGLNADGEITTMIRYSDAGAEITKALATDVDLTKVSIPNDDTTTHSLEKGDVFRFASNSKGEIAKIEAIYDFSEDKFLGTNEASETNDITKTCHPNESMYAYRINVYQADSSYIKTTKIPCESFADDSDMLLVLLSRNSVFKKAIIYDTQKNEVSTASTYQIRDYLTCGGDYTKGILWMRYGDPRRMILYK